MRDTGAMTLLAPEIDNWISQNGWQLHPHQTAMLQRAGAPSLLLIAPTGGGKTLAGFLPTLNEHCQNNRPGLHTLYISPLKALAADIKRNLRRPAQQIGLDIRVEDRTGAKPIPLPMPRQG